MDFAKELKKMRMFTEMSQEKAAAYLHISKKTLQNWEQGRRRPPDITQSAILERLYQIVPEETKKIVVYN